MNDNNMKHSIRQEIVTAWSTPYGIKKGPYGVHHTTLEMVKKKVHCKTLHMAPERLHMAVIQAIWSNPKGWHGFLQNQGNLDQ